MVYATHRFREGTVPDGGGHCVDLLTAMYDYNKGKWDHLREEKKSQSYITHIKQQGDDDLLYWQKQLLGHYIAKLMATDS